MASTRSQSTRSTRSSKPLSSISTPLETSSMEVDEVVSGLQQLARGATDFSKSSPTTDQSNSNKDNNIKDIKGDKDKDKGGGGGESILDNNVGGSSMTTTTDSSFPNNLLDAVASSTAMETEPPPAAESSSNSSSSDSSDTSDSDDSSETDEETAAKNKIQDGDDIQILEKMFLYTREQAYDERMRSVNTKLEEVRSGRAKEYLNPLEQLQENMSVKIEIASKRREYRIINLEHKTAAENIASQQNINSENHILFDNIKYGLEDRIRRLEEDRHNDFSSEFWYETVLKNKRNKKSIDIFGEKKKKPCNVNGPYIVYMLSDVDIMEDWTAVKKILAAPKRKCVDPFVF